MPSYTSQYFGDRETGKEIEIDRDREREAERECVYEKDRGQRSFIAQLYFTERDRDGERQRERKRETERDGQTQRQRKIEG